MKVAGDGDFSNQIVVIGHNDLELDAWVNGFIFAAILEATFQLTARKVFPAIVTSLAKIGKEFK